MNNKKQAQRGLMRLGVLWVEWISLQFMHLICLWLYCLTPFLYSTLILEIMSRKWTPCFFGMFLTMEGRQFRWTFLKQTKHKRKYDPHAKMPAYLVHFFFQSFSQCFSLPPSLPCAFAQRAYVNHEQQNLTKPYSDSFFVGLALVTSVNPTVWG